jgi:colicin import membrane protein
MNRLQKKCLVATTGFHLLLILILIIGPAFLSSRDKSDNLPVLDFIPFKTVDALVSGGGNPKAQPPAPAPAPAVPQPPPVAVPQPHPAPPPPLEKSEPAPKESTKEIKNDSASLEPSKERKHTVEVSTKLVKRDTTATSDSKARAEAQAKELADARRQATAAIRQAVSGIQGGVSGSTTIELKGPGGGGLPYANWLQAVKSVYSNAWLLPDGVTDESATATASVSIARDGTVISARITRFSGSAAVDRSVQAALERVKYAAPLPDDAKEDERTVSINFNAKSKLLG